MENVKGKVVEYEKCEFRVPQIYSGEEEYSHLSFKQCDFYESVIFEKIKVLGDVDFIECTFHNNSKLNFLSGNFEGDVKLGIKKLKHLYLSGGSYKSFQSGYWGRKSVIENVTIEHSSNISGNVEISDTSIEGTLLLRGENTNATFLFRRLHVLKFSIFRFETTNRHMFDRIEAVKNENSLSEFSVYKSNLGNSDFVMLDFDSFDKVNWRESIFHNCLFLNCSMNRSFDAEFGLSNGEDSVESNIGYLEMLNSYLSHEENADIVSEKNINEYKQKIADTKDIITKGGIIERELVKVLKRDNFRQLKISFQRQVDRVNEAKFHSLEMLEYSKLKDTNWWDWFIIKMSYISSGFGQKISKPIVINIFIIHSILFTLYWGFFNNNGYYLSIEDSSWNDFRVGFNEYFNLLSPFRRWENPKSSILEWLFRVNSGMLIYNVVRASRKFNY